MEIKTGSEGRVLSLLQGETGVLIAMAEQTERETFQDIRVDGSLNTAVKEWFLLVEKLEHCSEAAVPIPNHNFEFAFLINGKL